MPSSPSRGPITTRLFTELETAGFPVGDNAAPTEDQGVYGWQGEPDGSGSAFTPWMTIAPGTASPQNPAGALGDTGREWRLMYTVYYAGVSRKQCEALADKMRDALTNISRESVTTPTGNWKIQKVSCTNIGTNNRVGSTFPDYSSQADTFDVWITKEG